MNLKNLIKGQDCADVGELVDRLILHIQDDPLQQLVICEDCGHEEGEAEPDACIECSQCGGTARGAEDLLIMLGGC